MKGNYAASVADYDKVHAEILGMADILSTGIVNQFPDKFGMQAPSQVGMPSTGGGVPTYIVLGTLIAVALSMIMGGGAILARRSA